MKGGIMTVLKENDMNAMELYELLNEHGVEYDVVEIFEGVRILSVSVDELDEEDLINEETQNG